MTEAGSDSDEARRRLYQIMEQDASFEDKAMQAIELGKNYLEVDSGYIAEVVPQTDYWEILVTTESESETFVPEFDGNLQTQYCRRTIRQETSVTVHDAQSQGWADDPAFETTQLHCYHGTPITIDEETYGTVCFVSATPREPFTEAETMFAEMIARLLENELESRQASTKLSRRKNLNDVLTRVLRHNLRNGMTVIRGKAHTIADHESVVASHGQSIIEKADQLIELSEKARKLESVLVGNFERRDVEIQGVIEHVTQQIGIEYPSATITVTGDEVTLGVSPSLEIALYELLENAVKHTGDEPTVFVSIDADPDAVEIRIQDTGDGLADIEQAVLTDGVEKPVVHGRGLGLWLAYWIVTSHSGTIGATVTAEGTEMRIRLPRGELTTGEIRDEVEEVPFRRVQDRFRAVFDEAVDAIMIVDDDGHIVDANRSSGELLGVEATELLGHPIADFVGDDCAFDPAQLQTTIAGHDQGTCTVVRADGSERTVEFTAASNVVPRQHLLIFRNISTRERD